MRFERILDVNQNRCSEGLRVLESYTRFIKEDEALTTRIRNIRHFIRKELSKRWILHRNSEGDIGKKVSQGSNLDRKESIQQLLRANASRVEESLRVLEEYLKVTGNYFLSKEIEKKRFECYHIEKRLMEDFFVNGLYAITANGSEEEILNQVDLFIKHGIKWVQYRDKKHDYEIIRKIAYKIMEKVKGTDCKVFINDYPLLAVEVSAHGVHVGQGDMPVSEVRKINPNLLVGVSTHNRQQFLKAVEDKPDYIALGPIFGTNTKENPEACEGISFAEFTRKETDIPLVAIGGINQQNIHQVKAIGIDSFAMIESIKEEEKMVQMKQLIDVR